jgi:hypothetical protein
VSTEIQKFTEIFMPRACEKYKYVKKKMGIDTLEFLVDDIRRPFNHDHPEKSGFNIVAWPDQYIENTLLPPLIDEGLIESISPRRYRIREASRVGIHLFHINPFQKKGIKWPWVPHSLPRRTSSQLVTHRDYRHCKRGAGIV